MSNTLGDLDLQIRTDAAGAGDLHLRILYLNGPYLDRGISMSMMDHSRDPL